MFTIEQINDLHVRLGSAKTFPNYVPGLKALGVGAIPTWPTAIRNTWGRPDVPT
jgi:hypothetical protein